MRVSYAGGRAVFVLGATALFLMTAAGGRASAQRGGARPTAAERRLERMTRQGEQYERDRLMRDLKGQPLDPEARKHAETVASQIRHDLEGLQKGYNRIVLATASKDGRGAESISGAISDIRKCAGRLKTSLALPRPKEEEGEKERGGAAPAQAEEPLAALLKHIYSFITNPLFEAPSVLDLEQAKRATQDLDRIIALSEALGKSGDRAK